ncbi:hypothetical protein [Salinifilum ghardaiensis]
MPHDLTHRTRSWLRTTVPVVWAAIIDSSGALAAPDWITARSAGPPIATTGGNDFVWRDEFTVARGDEPSARPRLQ